MFSLFLHGGLNGGGFLMKTWSDDTEQEFGIVWEEIKAILERLERLEREGDS